MYLLLSAENHKAKTPPPTDPSCPASSPLPGDAPPLAPPLGPESTGTRTAGRSRGRGRRRAEGRGRGVAGAEEPLEDVGGLPNLPEGGENGLPSPTTPPVSTAMGVGRRTSVLFNKAKNGARLKKAEPVVNGSVAEKSDSPERDSRPPPTLLLPDRPEHAPSEPSSKTEPAPAPSPSSPRHLRSRGPSALFHSESQNTHTQTHTPAPHTHTPTSDTHTPAKDSGKETQARLIIYLH